MNGVSVVYCTLNLQIVNKIINIVIKRTCKTTLQKYFAYYIGKFQAEIAENAMLGFP